MTKEELIKIVGINFVVHFSSVNWGDEILIMQKDGKAFARAYWYKDDSSTIYLDFLKVDEDIRKQGIGTELQIIREDIGILLNCIYSCLWVKKDSWMYEWYKRRGYKDYKNHERLDNTMWMRKELNVVNVVNVVNNMNIKI